MSIHLPAAILAMLLLSLAAASGCRQSREAFADSAREHPPIQLPAHDASRVPVHDRPGIAHGGTLSLPADFPDDIYLPAGYRIDSLMDRGALRVVSLRVPGQVSTLFDDARASMDERGWKQTLAMRDASDSALLNYEKDNRAAVLSFSDDHGRGGVTMNVQLHSGMH
ncbi:hypothetical protein [Luteimonas mephitis]|uniref:hypothetical protein n=1 Tax=Luteimonas mephitis TaxID=83615 RepID=UPI0003FB5C60|nr:hypothetical protein [Luteimonas mephitis]